MRRARKKLGRRATNYIFLQIPIPIHMRPSIFGLVALLGSAQVLDAQNTQTLDLAVAKTSDTVLVKPGSFRFIVASKLPMKRYYVAVSSGSVVLAPLPAAAFGLSSTSCADVEAFTKALTDVKSEREVVDIVRRARVRLDAPPATPGACANELRALRVRYDATRYEVEDSYTLAAGDFVTVTVERFDEAGKSEGVWYRRYSTGAPGEWRATYGFVLPFLTRVSGRRLVREGQQFTAKQIDTTSRYVITPGRNVRQFDVVPSVMFSYQPAERKGRQWPSLSAGLGTDLTKPVLMLGFGYTYRENLHVSVGAASREERLLAGHLSPGDTVRTALTEAQLVENAFRVRPYLSVTLRFDTNPFKKEASKEVPAEKTADPKPAKPAGSMP